MGRLLNAAMRGAAIWAMRGAAHLPAPPLIERPVTVMGIGFANPLGLAAGFDRDGSLCALLGACGFGFVEIGTVVPGPAAGGLAAIRANLARRRGRREAPRIGINIGSRHDGFSGDALGDYVRAMSALWEDADYFAANLSSPRAARRRGGGPPADFVAALCATRDALTAASGRRVPLVAKLVLDEVPATALATLKSATIDGVVGVSADLAAVAAAAAALAPVPLLSVGGVGTAVDVAARLERGAALVQTYRGFVRGGPFAARKLLAAAPHRERRPTG